MATREGYERMLRLAAYVRDRRTTGCTITDIEADVPGYRKESRSALEKAVQRDIATLGEDPPGIMIEWSDAEQRYFVQPPMFTATERHALIAAATAVEVDGVGEELDLDELGAAVEKDLARVVVRVHHHVVALRDAIAARQAIAFTYQGNEGGPEPRLVDPYAVGLWRNRWYCIGRDHDRDERRVFRLDRIVAAGGTETITIVGDAHAYEIPADVDPVADLKMDPNSWGADPPLLATVRVNTDFVPTFLGEFAGRRVARDASSSTVEVEVRDYESFLIRLLGFGTAVHLSGPDELVARLRGWLAGQVGA
jgi:predicted DNA-binding transcriptional regulator YafY